MSGGVRVLVAHNVPRRRSGGMSRIMGSIHDELTPLGYVTEYFCAEDARGAAAVLPHLTFPLLALRHATAAATAGRPYDIVNVHESQGFALAAWRSHRAAVVVTSHGVDQRGWEVTLEEQARGYPGPAAKTRIVHPALRLWQSRGALRRADHVLCLSEQDRRYMTTRLQVRADRITRIAPGASAPFAAVADARSYDRTGTLLFGGTWLSRKGIGDLVAAFERIHASGVSPRLIVFGGGAPDDHVRASFPEHLRTFVTCLSANDDDAAAAVYAQADIFVLPSTFEGTPLTLIEAMATGLPVITTATSGMQDVIRHGDNGMLTGVHDVDALVRSLTHLLASAPGRERLGRAAALEARSHYTWADAARPVAKVYAHLLEGRRPA